MVFADITLAGGQRRHELVEIKDAMKRVELVIFIGLAVQVRATAATNSLLLAVPDEFQNRMEAQKLL